MDRPTNLREAYARADAEQTARPQPERGTPSSVVRLDELVELSRSNPAAFAGLDAVTRRRVGERAAHLDHRARQENAQ
ncbi:hypothetical protein AB0K48_06325 [Nonomuraea sp. NPDC055795]